MKAPFADLLEYLRAQGFPIGVESHLRLRMLLNQLGENCAPGDLKTILCPLFATNSEQQELFYRTFDAFYPDLAEPRPEASSRLLTATAAGGGNAKASSGVRRWPYLLSAAMLLVVSVAILTRVTPRIRTPAAPSAPTLDQRPAPVQNPLQPLPGAPTEPKGQKLVDVRQLPPSFSPSLAKYSDLRVALGWTALLGPLVFWLLYEAYRLRRKQFLIRKHHGKAPPYSWPIQSGQRNPSIYDAQQLAGVSQLLHRRDEAESERLDVEGTVVSSIASLGFPVFQYRKDTRLPEYLFLIDRCNFRDHQACLFDNLAGVLQEQGLFVNAWFYEGDPRICWDKAGEESLDLEELQRRFSGRRLLIFGDGDEFLDPVTGRIAHWHRLLWGWRDRALLTPRAPRGWSIPEYTLATQFLVAPATLDGLNAVASYFDMPHTDESGFRGEAVESPESGDERDTEMSLRRLLGDGAFQWLCACAVYPELHWDLTLRLGSLPSMPPGLVREENIVRLLRLPWFRNGSMPGELRRKLIGHLDPALQREVRESIVQLLENNPAPTGTHAADTFQFQIAYQRYWGNPRDRKARQRLKDAIENLAPDELTQDYAYLEAAESARRSPLHILLPGRLRKFLRSAVGASPGFRTVARGFVTVVIMAASLLTLHFVDGKVTAAKQEYRDSLSAGPGLSLSESNGFVRIAWSPGSFAGQYGVRGLLTVQDFGRSKAYAIDLNKDQLKDGEREIKPESSPVTVTLILYDERGNTVEQTVGIAEGLVPDPTAYGGHRLGWRVFQPPPSGGSRISPAPLLDQPAETPAGGAVPSTGGFDPLLTSTSVLPPPPPKVSVAPDSTPRPGELKTNRKDGQRYAWIPPGTFQMGCSPGDEECHDDENPARSVTMSKGFWMGQTEVTQEAYRRVTGKNPSGFKGEKRPVENVTWTDASEYCGKSGGLRLPTDAEWEYAARAGNSAPRYGNLDAVAWHGGNSGGQTHPVSGKQPNAWGLHDMLGNVAEWTADYGESGRALRALRGGAYGNNPSDVRVSGRGEGDPGFRLSFIGFRCVGELP